MINSPCYQPFSPKSCRTIPTSKSPHPFVSWISTLTPIIKIHKKNHITLNFTTVLVLLSTCIETLCSTETITPMPERNYNNNATPPNISITANTLISDFIKNPITSAKTLREDLTSNTADGRFTHNRVNRRTIENTADSSHQPKSKFRPGNFHKSFTTSIHEGVNTSLSASTIKNNDNAFNQRETTTNDLSKLTPISKIKDSAGWPNLTMVLKNEGHSVKVIWEIKFENETNKNQVQGFIVQYKMEGREDFDSSRLGSQVRLFILHSLHQDKEYSICVQVIGRQEDCVIVQVCKNWSQQSMKLVMGIIAGSIFLLPGIGLVIWVVYKDRVMRKAGQVLISGKSRAKGYNKSECKRDSKYSKSEISPESHTNLACGGIETEENNVQDNTTTDNVFDVIKHDFREFKTDGFAGTVVV